MGERVVAIYILSQPVRGLGMKPTSLQVFRSRSVHQSIFSRPVFRKNTPLPHEFYGSIGARCLVLDDRLIDHLNKSVRIEYAQLWSGVPSARGESVI